MSSGKVKCWGRGDLGELGDGGSGAGHNQLPAADVQVSGGGLLTGATQVTLGANFGCALLESGLVDCWGKNDVGQLGQGITSGLSAFAKPVLTEVGGSPLQGATQVTAGGAHACVRMYTDRLKCWGQGEAGQLGDGSSGSGAPARSHTRWLTIMPLTGKASPTWKRLPRLAPGARIPVPSSNGTAPTRTAVGATTAAGSWATATGPAAAVGHRSPGHPPLPQPGAGFSEFWQPAAG